MKIGIIDADLVGRKNHRFPNLCCMKISAFHKDIGNDVKLVLDCSNLSTFDIVYDFDYVLGDQEIEKRVSKVYLWVLCFFMACDDAGLRG